MTRLGRPRTGPRASRLFRGEKVSLFVKLTGRYPAPLAARLRVLALEQGEPLWVLLVEAAEAYLSALPSTLKAHVQRRARRDVHALQASAVESYERELLRKAQKR
jgi:hypothetical protein